MTWNNKIEWEDVGQAQIREQGGRQISTHKPGNFYNPHYNTGSPIQTQNSKWSSQINKL